MQFNLQLLQLACKTDLTTFAFIPDTSKCQFVFWHPQCDCSGMKAAVVFKTYFYPFVVAKCTGDDEF